MLDQELWKRLPAPLPSLAEALMARSSSTDEVGGSGTGSSSGAAAGDYAAFEAFVVRGNPWRKQQSPRRHRHAAAQLGLGGTAAATGSSASARLEVDEYGVPRAGSGSLSMPASAGGSRPSSAQSAGSVGASRSGTEGDELIDLAQDSSDAFGELCFGGMPESGRGWMCSTRQLGLLLACANLPTASAKCAQLRLTFSTPAPRDACCSLQRWRRGNRQRRQWEQRHSTTRCHSILTAHGQVDARLCCPNEVSGGQT